MRGTPICHICIPDGFGIIPAYAGNTTCSHSPSPTKRDHPRVCGEHFFRSFVDEWGAGSSPRMRGTRLGEVSCKISPGIIPAYAGNTPVPIRFVRKNWDHPRVCGEHRWGMACVLFHSGSSPRMRGTREQWVQRCPRLGIIPAYAGNTLNRLVGTTCTRDHPRVCGEHFISCGDLPFTEGSSPRMRGTHRYQGWRDDGEGIIPAYAGNTPHCRRRRNRLRDHPRVCGEHPSVPR